MSWWEGVILIIVYFVSLWTSRIFFTIILLKFISRLVEEMQVKIKDNIDSFKNSFSKGEGKENGDNM